MRHCHGWKFNGSRHLKRIKTLAHSSLGLVGISKAIDLPAQVQPPGSVLCAVEALEVTELKLAGLYTELESEEIAINHENMLPQTTGFQ